MLCMPVIFFQETLESDLTILTTDYNDTVKDLESDIVSVIFFEYQ